MKMDLGSGYDQSMAIPLVLHKLLESKGYFFTYFFMLNSF